MGDGVGQPLPTQIFLNNMSSPILGAASSAAAGGGVTTMSLVNISAISGKLNKPRMCSIQNKLRVTPRNNCGCRFLVAETELPAGIPKAVHLTCSILSLPHVTSHWPCSGGPSHWPGQASWPDWVITNSSVLDCSRPLSPASRDWAWNLTTFKQGFASGLQRLGLTHYQERCSGSTVAGKRVEPITCNVHSILGKLDRGRVAPITLGWTALASLWKGLLFSALSGGQKVQFTRKSRCFAFDSLCRANELLPFSRSRMPRSQKTSWLKSGKSAQRLCSLFQGRCPTDQ